MQEYPRIISLSYRQRVGKDLFFTLAKEIYKDKSLYRIAFADELKKEAWNVLLKPFNFSIDLFDNDDTKPVLRQFLQFYGTEFRRNPMFGGNENHWINKAFENIMDIYKKDPDTIFVITDCRYKNECLEAKKYNGICIKINRDTGKNDQHSSETALDDYVFDYTIDNNGTIEDYKIKIKQLLYTIFTQSEHSLT